ncbi:MAG TPA: formate/nitrite transporter family protein [Thermodesulfobacteriota bacterium]|nr:formate/nitrite transporter family protein [Thermodesulfobacteriota bacterium]
MPENLGIDAYSPKEIAEHVESIGVAKARLPLLTMAALGVVAGGFIGLGAMYFTLITSDPNLGFALSRLLGGLTFSLGLILVVVAGAELFTGNNLLVMAWTSRKITTAELFRNWVVVFFANLAGAMGLALIVVLSNHAEMNGGAVGVQIVKIAAAKASLPFQEALFKGVLCNVLVCMAVWLTLAGHSVTDKVLAIIFPISAFVAAGFEHSVANMYFIPLGILLKDHIAVPAAVNTADLTWVGFIHNLIPVTIGNVIGGSGLVALVYYVIYRRGGVR